MSLAPSRISVLALVAVLLAAMTGEARATDQCLAYEQPEKVGKVSTSRLMEISGLTVSRNNPEVLWVHNDSGGDNSIYAIAIDGEYLGRWELEGVAADDFEDIASGPCADGFSNCLYIADTGNNEGEREKFQVYRVEEPEFDLEDARDDSIKEEIDKDFVEKIKFRYPTDPDEEDETPDAEAMMVDGDGLIYIFTKSKKGTKLLTLEIPEDLDKRVTLSEVGVREDFFRTTGADLAPSGDRFVLRNLDEAREFTILPEQSIGDAFAYNDYVEFAVGQEKQGEAIGYTLDGLGILTTSEREKEPIYYYECAVFGELEPAAGKSDGFESDDELVPEASSSSGCTVVRTISPARPTALLALLVALSLVWLRRR